jgi:hypothetical protein
VVPRWLLPYALLQCHAMYGCSLSFKFRCWNVFFLILVQFVVFTNGTGFESPILNSCPRSLLYILVPNKVILKTAIWSFWQSKVYC